MKRRLVVAFAFALGLSAVPIAASAQPPPAPPGIGFAGKKEPPAADDKRWGDGKTGRGPEPIAEPARGGRSYNLTHIVYASAIMLAMLAFRLWLIRRHRRPD